ncbi:MAG: HAD family phosphatase [Paracoccaceae bacterium]
MKTPAAFLFDMDGLLLDTERVIMETFLEIFAPFDVSTETVTHFFLGLVGSSSAETQRQLLTFLPNDLPYDTFVSEWHTNFGAKMAKDVPIKPHVSECLKMLAEQGHRMAVVTSTKGDQARHHLTGAGLINHFELVTGGDEVSANKPDPAPYLETAQALGVSASDCFAFEDSDRGITAAVRAGCRAVQIPDLRPANKPLPDLGQHVAADFRQAMQILQVL